MEVLELIVDGKTCIFFLLSFHILDISFFHQPDFCVQKTFPHTHTYTDTLENCARVTRYTLYTAFATLLYTSGCSGVSITCTNPIEHAQNGRSCTFSCRLNRTPARAEGVRLLFRTTTCTHRPDLERKCAIIIKGEC